MFTFCSTHAYNQSPYRSRGRMVRSANQIHSLSRRPAGVSVVMSFDWRIPCRANMSRAQIKTNFSDVWKTNLTVCVVKKIKNLVNKQDDFQWIYRDGGVECVLMQCLGEAMLVGEQSPAPRVVAGLRKLRPELTPGPVLLPVDPDFRISGWLLRFDH